MLVHIMFTCLFERLPDKECVICGGSTLSETTLVSPTILSAHVTNHILIAMDNTLYIVVSKTISL
jgi:hypothetical protein